MWEEFCWIFFHFLLALMAGWFIVLSQLHRLRDLLLLFASFTLVTGNLALSPTEYGNASLGWIPMTLMQCLLIRDTRFRKGDRRLAAPSIVQYSACWFMLVFTSSPAEQSSSSLQFTSLPRASRPHRSAELPTFGHVIVTVLSEVWFLTSLKCAYLKCA